MVNLPDCIYQELASACLATRPCSSDREVSTTLPGSPRVVRLLGEDSSVVVCCASASTSL